MRVEVGSDGVLHLVLEIPLAAPDMAVDAAALAAAREEVRRTLEELGVGAHHMPPALSYRPDAAGEMELWRFSVTVPGTQELRAPKGSWGGRPRKKRRQT